MSAQPTRIEILHGVNLNTLGRRDPEIYGSFTLADLERRISEWSGELGIEASFFQSNYEAEFCDRLHTAGERCQGLIINAGAWTHYSWAIRDALEVAAMPAVEVHISDIASREKWRTHSVFDGLVLGVVSGEGMPGYRRALELLQGHLDPS